MTGLPAGLVEWARMPGPRAVLDTVRRRARQGHQTEAGTLRLNLSTGERREVALLLGTDWALSARSVRLQDLAARLVEHGLTVRGLVEALDGEPIEEDRELRRRAEASAVAERAVSKELLTASGVPAAVAADWLDDPVLPRPGAGDLEALVRRVCAVWSQLPAPDAEPVRLAVLAVKVTGGAHGLDHKELLGRSVARLAARMHGLPRPVRSGSDWRAAWRSAGVLCDEVSSRVLALNLPLHGDAPAVRLCASSPGEPVWLTLRSLAGRWSAPEGLTVYVCENPTVVEAAADALGRRCPPLACTDGTPASAAIDLVAGLVAGGCRIAVRADFDSAGFTVVDQIRSVAPGSVLWRFDQPTYLDAVGVPVAEPNELRPVPTGVRLEELRQAHGDIGRSLHEEALLDDLLDDLRSGRVGA